MSELFQQLFPRLSDKTFEITSDRDRRYNCVAWAAEYERVAIFPSGDGVPTHMARQLPDGSWTSKLGTLEDIAHVDVNGVGGSDYGEVVAFLRRPRYLDPQ